MTAYLPAAPGLRVLELGGIGPAPFAGMLLADLGADVVRVDRPQRVADPSARPDRPTCWTAASGRWCSTSSSPRAWRPCWPGRARRRPHRGLPAGRDGAAGHRSARVPGAQSPARVRPDDRLGPGWPARRVRGPRHHLHRRRGCAGCDRGGRGPPQIPLNLVGDFGGGGCYLVIGLLAALHVVAQTGTGQVVDAAIVDGTAHLLASPTPLARGEWPDQRGVNRFDGGWPFYAVYGTADGGRIAVGALEPQFYRRLVELLELDVDVRRTAPTPRPGRRCGNGIAAAFATRTRARWTAAVRRQRRLCGARALAMAEAQPRPPPRRTGHLRPRARRRRPARPGPQVLPYPRGRSPAARPGPVSTDDVLRDWAGRSSR